MCIERFYKNHFKGLGLENIYLFQIKLDYCSEVCEESFKVKSKTNHLKSLSHIQLEKCIHRIHAFKSPDFLDLHKIYNYYVSNLERNFDFNHIKIAFKLGFNNFTSHIKKPNFNKKL